MRAVKLVELPSESRIVHKDSCWEEAHWDTYPIPFKAQLWFISGLLSLQRKAESCAAKFRLDLHRWKGPQYDFHWHDEPVQMALERHRKHDVQKRFLHGDFRCGNLMITPDGVSAVLDWECSHLGAPMEDLAWLCTRSWRFDRPDLPVGGIGTRADFYQAYEAASGSRVDHSEVLFWEVFGLVRSAVYNIWQAHDHLTGQRRSVAYAACGRNTALVEYDLLMTLAGRYD